MKHLPLCQLFQQFNQTIQFIHAVTLDFDLALFVALLNVNFRAEDLFEFFFDLQRVRIFLSLCGFLFRFSQFRNQLFRLADGEFLRNDLLADLAL